MESYKLLAYNALKNKILTCQLKPNDIIDQNKVMKELGISRTPVREAIAVLEKENLVTVLPRRGVFVSNLSISEITQIFDTRDLIEPYCARVAAFLADPARLKYFQNIFCDSSDYLKGATADYEFHKYLVEVSRNPYLINTMDMVLSHNMRYVFLAASLPNRMKTSNDEHSQIIEAMLNKDVMKSEELMREHLKFARQSAYDSTPFYAGLSIVP